MTSATYQKRLSQLEHYFDRTAAEAWSRLTSDAPVSGIRATVRAGRDRMRATLLDWLPADLAGRRLLDAGCGTGALAVEAARRGAEVVAIDLSPTLVALAQERLPADLVAGHGAGSIDFRAIGEHDTSADCTLGVSIIDQLSWRWTGLDPLMRRRTWFGHASTACADGWTRAPATLGRLHLIEPPRTPALIPHLSVAPAVPECGDRAPAIEPVAEAALL